MFTSEQKKFLDSSPRNRLCITDFLLLFLLPSTSSIDTITGTTEFPFLQPQVSTVRSKELPSDWTPPSPNSASRISSQSSSSSAPPSCQTNVTTIECYRELYGTVDYQPRARDNNVIAVASFLEQYANYQDLSQFTQKYRPEAYEANYTFGFASINGGLNDQSMPGLEANLDTQVSGRVRERDREKEKGLVWHQTHTGRRKEDDEEIALVEATF